MIGQACNKCMEFGRFGVAQGVRDRDDHSWCKLCRRDNQRARYQRKTLHKGDVPVVLEVVKRVQLVVRGLDDIVQQGMKTSGVVPQEDDTAQTRESRIPYPDEILIATGQAQAMLSDIVLRLESIVMKAEKLTGDGVRADKEPAKPTLDAYLEDLMNWTNAGRIDKMREIREAIARDYPEYENTWENLQAFMVRYREMRR